METKKLSVYELMIGNWVYIYKFSNPTDLFPAKIVSIFQGSKEENYNTIECVYGTDIVSRPADTCLAIPITAEVLEKNGWARYEEDKNILILHDKSCVFIKQKDNGYGVCIDDVRTISGIIHYVHEFQNALQLCGVNKKILL